MYNLHIIFGHRSHSVLLIYAIREGGTQHGQDGFQVSPATARPLYVSIHHAALLIHDNYPQVIKLLLGEGEGVVDIVYEHAT